MEATPWRTENEAAIEEVISGLKILYDLDIHYKIKSFSELSNLVEKITGVKKSLQKSIVDKCIIGIEFTSAIKRADTFKSLYENPLIVRSIHSSLRYLKVSVFMGRMESVKAKLNEMEIQRSRKNYEQKKLSFQTVRYYNPETTQP